jgi:hypothetical protein
VSTNSTTSNYISKIDQEFPVAGQNNDSSGFRNNFKNIKSALTYVDQDVNDLKINSVKLIGTNDFNNSIIKRVILQNSSIMVYDDTGNIQINDVQLDYANGSYQKIQLSGGMHMITVTNWPVGAQSGSIILSVITNGSANTYINFNAVNLTSLGPDPLPMMLAAGTEQFFELWCDGDANNLFVRGLGGGNTPSTADIIAAASEIHISTATTLTINTNVFATSKDENNQYATTVTADNRAGNLALVPNQIKVRILNTAIVSVPDVLGYVFATSFPVSTTAGVMIGASLNFAGAINTSTFIVTDFTPTSITVTPAFDVPTFVPGDYVTITNPRFTEQPTVVVVNPVAVTTTTSVVGDLKGQIYADSTGVFVTYNDYSHGSTNKVKISSDSSAMITQPAATNSTALATTGFVHTIMPYGAIIMWHGSVSAVPTGWSLCDGTNQTPNLVDRFIVGAGASYAVGTTGGSADAVVVSHSHTGVTNTAGAHAHGYQRQNGLNKLNGGPLDTPLMSTYTDNTSVAGDHDHVLSIDAAGVSGTNANLPPFYALCYIMKVTGA